MRGSALVHLSPVAQLASTATVPRRSGSPPWSSVSGPSSGRCKQQMFLRLGSAMPLNAAMRSSCSDTPNLAELERMAARFERIEMSVVAEDLPAPDRSALGRLIAAADVVDEIFLTQYWSGNQALYKKLREDTTPLGKARLRYFWIHRSPWCSLDGHRAFLPGVPARKPLGANFYPENMSREYLENWMNHLPAESQSDARGFFTVIRQSSSGLHAVPFSTEYKTILQRLSRLLREAATLTTDSSLALFLNLRAYSFLTNDYSASEMAWMDLDGPLDVTIGPCETYGDELFGYKASFAAYVGLRATAEEERLRLFARHMPAVEAELPVKCDYKNHAAVSNSQIRIVNQITSAGDGAHGIRPAAYNLPNDPRIVQQRGSKRVMLRNIQEGKFRSILAPIAKRVLPASAQSDLSFELFFNHIMAHEMAHGIGPQRICVAGRDTTVRQELKELYGAIEEAKADVTGLFVMQYMFDRNLIFGGPVMERKLYMTYLASAFRTLRFGLHRAHGRATLLQFNYLKERGAFTSLGNGTFAVDLLKIKPALRDLNRDLLTIEATGDYRYAQSLLSRLGELTSELRQTIESLRDIPVDIEPVPVITGVE